MSKPTTRSKNKRQRQGDDGSGTNEIWRYFQLFLVCEMKFIIPRFSPMLIVLCVLHIGELTKQVWLLRMI